MAGKGALGTDPKFKLASDLDALRKQRTQLDAGRGKNANYAAQRKQVNDAILAAKKTASTPADTSIYGNPNPVDPSGSGANDNQYQQQWDQTNQGANQAQQALFNQIQQQGAFNPGSFADQQKGAYDAVMNQFNQTNQKSFDKQEADFQQMAAERGWDPTSKAFANAHQMNVLDPQQQARQQAESQAYGQGMAAQAQGYGQASQTYQMPYSNLSAFSPYYQGQTQNNLQNDAQGFTGNQNYLNRNFADYEAQQQQNYTQANAALQQKYNMQQMQFQAAHQKGGGGGGHGGGGGMSLADQMALQNNAFYNNMALQAGQQGGGYSGQTFGNGLAQGIGAAIPGVVNSIFGSGLKS